jgi:hypothetical protein
MEAQIGRAGAEVLDDGTWIYSQFAGVQVGDVRRSWRIQQMAELFLRFPGRRWSAVAPDGYAMKAGYTVLRREEVTPAALQAPHRDGVRRALEEPGTTVLLLQDLTEAIYSGRCARADLGPVGAGLKGQQGFFVHSALAVRWPAPPAGDGLARPPVEVLGLADQRYRLREPKPRGEADNASHRRLQRRRESQWWSELVAGLGPAPAGVRWCDVADRGADIYEYLMECRRQGHGFVVRACQNRCLEASAGPSKLFEAARAAPVLGEVTLDLRTRPKVPARQVRLSLQAVAVTLRSPQRPGHRAGSLPGVPVWAVRVAEVSAPPPGEKRLEWILVTDRVGEGFDEALEVALQYRTRWFIEEFHRVLKEGLGIEELQLESGHALMAATAILSVVALRVLDLKEKVRAMPDAPAPEAGLTDEELAVLSAWLDRPLETVRDVGLALGRLGGHLNRKGDGMPGAKTLMRGLYDLHRLVEGYRLATALHKPPGAKFG